MRPGQDPIFWRGPVLAGNRLVLVSSRGQIAYISPTDGSILSTTDDGSLAGAFPDQVRTEFAPGAGLKEARCSCGARSW